MTNTDYQAYLFSNQADIEDKILKHFSLDTSIIYNKDLCLDIMIGIVEQKTEHWITTATLPPELLDNFNPTAFFLSQWIKNIYPYIKMQVFEKANSYYASSISLDDCLELKSDENVEEDVMLILFREELKKANEEFMSKISKVDQKVMHSMYKDLSDKEKVELLFPNAEYTIKLKDKVRYMINVLEFRYACFILYKQLWNEEKVLRKLNKMPKLVKRYFGTDKLLSAPDNSALLAAAFNTEPNKVATTPKPFIRPTPFSKVDFNGKKHDHFVVYELNGSLYDHVTKETKMKETI